MKSISQTELAEKSGLGASFQLIDVRTPGEFAGGSVSGAINLPIERISEWSAELDRSGMTILVCQSGARAKSAYDLLESTTPNLAVLDGGYAAWRSANRPMTTSQNSVWSIERQIRFAAGSMVFLGSTASLFWRPAVFLAIFVGGGLVITSLIDWCGMGILLSKMPWNLPKETSES